MKWIMVCLLPVVLLASASSARASFHLWDIIEIYSNADGSVQFVELISPVGSFGEHVLAGHFFRATAADPDHQFTFPNNLPSNQTSGRSFLIATPGFAALPGAVTPDYTFPSTNFFSTVADTLNFADVDTIIYTAGQFPTDGRMSINRSLVSACNSPKNFARQIGGLSLVPGDVDCDGDVDRSDAAQMAINFGRMAAATRAQGDLTGDGRVSLLDVIDLQLHLDEDMLEAINLQRHLGAPIATAAAGVPEPATAGMALALAAAAGLYAVYRRGTRRQLQSRA